jgi:hypothetical protein
VVKFRLAAGQPRYEVSDRQYDDDTPTMIASELFKIVREAAWPPDSRWASMARCTRRVWSRFLVRHDTHDPATFAAVAVLTGVTATLAEWIPARRAGRVDPITALLGE